jgi:hypothetical protein
LAAQSTIVYADLCGASPQLPSAVAASIAQAARDNWTFGQFEIASRALSTAEVRQAIDDYPSGHERLARDTNLVLLDAGAMLAYAPYRARILLTKDPFACVEQIHEVFEIDANSLRIRLHEALLMAERIITLNDLAFAAVSPLVSKAPERKLPPAMALQVSGSGILIVNNEDERTLRETVSMLAETFPEEEFTVFDRNTVFDRSWKLVLHLGIAQSSQPGSRLSDAWAGGVPVLQYVNSVSLNAQRKRYSGQPSELIVDHGRTGLLFYTIDDLRAMLGDLLFDVLPARAVARTARRHADPAAEWDALLKVVFQ